MAGRRIARSAAVLALFCAVAVIALIAWVDRALAATLRQPLVLCLTVKDRQKIASGSFPEDRRDVLVTKAINFRLGVPTMIWWHLRGAAIHLTYVTFWSPARRLQTFSDLTSAMRNCPPNLERPASTPATRRNFGM